MLRQQVLDHAVPVGAVLGLPRAKAFRLLQRAREWSADEMEQHQNHAFRALIDHCYHHVPYYRQLMITRGLQPCDFRTTRDLEKLPYLTREIIREEGARLRGDNYPAARCQFRRSGGTTGEPIEVAVDRRARAFEVAAYFRGFRWMRYELGRPMVRLFGGTLGLPATTSIKNRFKNWIFNTRFLPAFELTCDNLDHYLEAVRQANDGVLVGYASAVRNLAEYMSQRGVQGSPLASVICTAEHMPEEWRSFIGQVFQAPVFCYYGCGEVNSIAYECADEDGYLVCDEHVVLEAADGDPGRFRTFGQGEACVTTLFNYAMPLLRYLNGDMLELGRPSGRRPQTRIGHMEGRVVDQLTTVAGDNVSGALIPHMVFQSGFPAWKYQVIQLDTRTLRLHYALAGHERLSDDMKHVLQEILRRHLGKEMDVNFVEDDFETGQSRKHRFVVNHLHSTPETNT